MDYRVLGAIMLGACASLVGGGVKYVSIVSPFFLVPVALSIACILLGIATAEGRRGYFLSLAEETCGAKPNHSPNPSPNPNQVLTPTKARPAST